jgi:hypothetical protein
MSCRQAATAYVHLAAVDRAQRCVEPEPLAAEHRVFPGLQGAQHLACERLVDFVEVEILQPQIGAFEHARDAVGGRHQQALVARAGKVDGRGLRMHQIGQRLVSVRSGPVFRGQQHRRCAVG